jgi:hypothetical protein
MNIISPSLALLMAGSARDGGGGGGPPPKADLDAGVSAPSPLKILAVASRAIRTVRQ